MEFGITGLEEKYVATEWAKSEMWITGWDKWGSNSEGKKLRMKKKIIQVVLIFVTQMSMRIAMIFDRLWFSINPEGIWECSKVKLKSQNKL